MEPKKTKQEQFDEAAKELADFDNPYEGVDFNNWPRQAQIQHQRLEDRLRSIGGLIGDKNR